MKKHISIVLVLLLMLAMPAFSHAAVIITEIMYDLQGADSGREWIEVKNTGPTRDLSFLWKFVEGGTNHSITYVSGGEFSSGSMQTDEYAIIVDNPDKFLADWPDYTGKLFDSSFSLSNDGETLVMFASSLGGTTDEVTYASSTGAQGDGSSLQRQSDDTWITAFPTPGAPTSETTETVNEEVVEEEVFTPYYIIDEKDRVLFGDSTEIESYHGLENYIQEYVNGYAHITFTYTHNQCCYASYPPRIVVSSMDPSATTTPEIKFIRDIYQIMQFGHNNEHTTEWYSYDIQFDAAGYTLSVKRAGATEVTLEGERRVEIESLEDSDWVAIKNEYTRTDPPNEYSMAFTPFSLIGSSTGSSEEPASGDPPSNSRTPVIIVPGIMGSYLNRDDDSNEEVWMNLFNMALSREDSYLSELKLTELGEVELSFIPTDIIRKVNIPLFNRDIFDGLIREFIGAGYIEQQDLFVFPYDWRLDVEISTQKLRERIDEIKLQTGGDKVDIVAHSMGGILVKEYLKEFNGSSVRTFVDSGSPHLGAPKSFLTLMYGDTDISILNKATIKSILQNMPAVYQLLPSRNYFDDSDSSYKYYVFDGVNNSQRLTFDETSNYLKSAGRNSLLVDRADEFHQQLDGLNPADYGVETYNIVGCGTPTLGQIYVLGKKGDKYVYNIKMINGDGTVPLKSAEAMQATTYYAKGAVHAVMPSSSDVKELIVEILSEGNADISQYQSISSSSFGCTIPNGKIVSFHSPIDLHVYDESGNHVGPDENGDIENNIDGIIYEVIDDNKFAYLPDGAEYMIKGSATGEGSFDILFQEIVDGEVVATTAYSDIPLILTTQTQFTVSSVVPAQISLDYDNDGTFESSKVVSNIYTGFIESYGSNGINGNNEIAEEVSSETTSNSWNYKAVTEEDVQIKSIDIRDESREEAYANIHRQLAEISAILEVMAAQEEKVLEESEEQEEMVSVLQLAPETELDEGGDQVTAAAYNSVGQRLKVVFKRMWVWFRSKL